MDSRQTTVIWTDVGEQTMDDDGGVVVSTECPECRGIESQLVQSQLVREQTEINIHSITVVNNLQMM